MEQDNPSFQDAFTHQIATRDAFAHQIWNFYLKEYKRCAQDRIILKTRSEVKITVTRKWYVTLRYSRMHLHQILNPYLKEYRRYAQDSKHFLETRSEVKFNVTGTQGWCATLCHLKMHPNTKFGIPPNTKFWIPSLNNIGYMLPTRLF